MKNGKTEHYWRIHKRVALRLMGDLPPAIQDAIAADSMSDQAVWYDNKVTTDATRLYEDPSYYDNAELTFRFPREEFRPIRRR